MTVEQLAQQAFGRKGKVTVLDSTETHVFLTVESSYEKEFIISRVDNVNHCLYNGNYSLSFVNQSKRWLDIIEAV